LNKQFPSLQLLFNDHPVATNDALKYLGITIDAKLNFNLQISQLERKISRSVGIMAKLRHVLPSKALCTLYYCMIHPYLLYGIVIWGTTFKTYLKRLSTLQNRAVKIIAGVYWRDNATPYFATLNILKLEDIYKHEIAKLMHKCAHKNTPESFTSFFTFVNTIHTRSTRLASNKFNLYLPRYKTNKLQRSFKYQGVKE